MLSMLGMLADAGQHILAKRLHSRTYRQTPSEHRLLDEYPYATSKLEVLTYWRVGNFRFAVTMALVQMNLPKHM